MLRPAMPTMSARRSQRLWAILAASAIAVALPATAAAQNVDHGELQNMFGEPVTTSVTGSPKRASEAPAALIIITRNDIKRSPARDIPGLLQAYAGIDVVHWTAGHADVAIRGGVRPLQPGLLVMVNGRQVYLDHYGMTNWAGIGVQLEEIQQIEIVQGPNSALFGFNAVSGVVNIITIDPLQTQQMVTTLEAGTEGHRRVSQSASLKLKDWLGLRLSGGYQASDEYDGLAASQASNNQAVPDPRQSEIAGEIYVRGGQGTDASLSATYSKSRHLELTEFLHVIPIEYRFVQVSGRVSHDTGWGVLTARAFSNSSDVAPSMDASPQVGAPPANDDDGSDIVLRNRVFAASAEALVHAGTANTLRAGIEYRSNSLKFPGRIPDTSYGVYAASGMWESRLNDALTFTVAGRLDHLKLVQQQSATPDTPAASARSSLTEWSFNSALLFKLNPANTLRLSAGRGVQAPSLMNLGTRNPFGGSNVVIEPAIVHSAEAGYVRVLGAINGQAELTAFYHHTNKVISVNSNVGTFEAFGVTAALTGRLVPAWTWNLNYTWTKADEEIVGNEGGQFAYPITLGQSTPEHKIKAQVSYERGAWLATVATRYTSSIHQLVATGALPFQTRNLVAIDDTIAVDAKVAFEANKHVTVTVAGENLTDSAGVNLTTSAAERRLRASLQVRF